MDDDMATEPPDGDDSAADPVGALNKAIDDGDAGWLERLLEVVSDLNAYDSSGWRPLKRAIHVGSAPFVERLLKAGVDPNARPEMVDEASALAAAVLKNRPDLVDLLLRRGAAPRVMGEKDPDPLNDACAMNSVEIVKLLLEAGAAVDGHAGNTPLISTARAMSPEVARLLLARGPDVNRVDRDGRTALWWVAFASPYGCAPVNVVKVDPSENLSPAELAKRFEPPPPPTPEKLRRHEAKIIEFVRLLLDHGADPNIQDRSGKPPLATAKCASVAKLLIERGARVDVRDRSRRGIYDWLALSRIDPAALGLGPRPQADEPPKDERPKRPARKRTGK